MNIDESACYGNCATKKETDEWTNQRDSAMRRRMRLKTIYERWCEREEERGEKRDENSRELFGREGYDAAIGAWISFSALRPFSLCVSRRILICKYVAREGNRQPRQEWNTIYFFHTSRIACSYIQMHQSDWTYIWNYIYIYIYKQIKIASCIKRIVRTSMWSYKKNFSKENFNRWMIWKIEHKLKKK